MATDDQLAEENAWRAEMPELVIKPARPDDAEELFALLTHPQIT